MCQVLRRLKTCSQSKLLDSKNVVLHSVFASDKLVEGVHFVKMMGLGGLMISLEPETGVGKCLYQIQK